jgi:hypothetical protein
MALSQIEDRYLSALTAVQFPDMPVEPVTAEQPAEAMPSMDGMQLAAGPSRTMSDAGGGMGEIKPYDPTVRERMAEFLQAGFERFGMDRFRARKQAQTLMGGQSSNLPLDLGLADIVPFLGTALQTQEAVRMGGDAVTSAQQGNLGTAALQAGGAALGLVPGAVGTVKAGKGVAKMAGQELNRAILDGTGPLAAVVPQSARPLNIVQPGPGVANVSPEIVRERVPGVQPGEELIVQHNLTAANLLKADKLGGLPVPSLAISRAASPMDNFGEITLIAPKEFANPSAKNPVFGADAYTARFPKIDYQIDSKSKKPLRGLVADVIDKLPGGDYNFDRLMNDWSDRQYNQILRAKFLDERGALPDPKDFQESWKFDSTIGQLVRDNQSEYQDWLAKFDDSLADAGVNVKERIFKGFTYAGDRRYAAATLDNIVKEMKGGAGGEGFNYGVGNLRAVATPKFRTLSQIKAARGKLVDGKKMDEIKQQAQDAYVSVLNRMREVNDKYSAEDALLEFAESKRISTLDQIYDGKMPNELKADIGIFLQKIQELPTEYFELKPQRAVSLEEFKGAIIPANTPKSARDVLNKAGITEIYEYSTPEERKSLFQKYGKEMFTAAPGGTALGAATMQDKEQK